MKDKELIKEAYEEAQNDLKQKRKNEVKKIVTETLKKIKNVEREIDKVKEQLDVLEKQKKMLRMDINDLKEGRLDRIEERQNKDDFAKKVSVVKVEKTQKQTENDRWYEPWKITWIEPNPEYKYDNSPFCFGHSYTSVADFNGISMTLDNSTVKYFAPGTYQIGEAVIHLT